MHLTPIPICSLSSSAMLRQTVLSLLLACAVSLSSSAVILDNGMPVLWNEAVGLAPQNGVLAPHPWNFLNRMGLYRQMIERTNPFMGPMGTGANENPMFGLPLQLAWMLTSGRLADPTGLTNCGMETGDTMCISSESWWACENSFVSVLPFLSAAQNELMGEGLQVQMQAPDGVTEYCNTYADCSSRFPDAMMKWDAYFKGLVESSASPLPDNEKKDILLGLYWAAQMASTYAAAVACEAKKSHLSGPENAFANAWLNSAEYVAAVHFQSGLELAAKFIEPLPGKVLKEGDVAPNIEGLSTVENNMLVTFSWLDTINTSVGGSLVSQWQKAMCTVSTRERGRALLEKVLVHTDYSSFGFLSEITIMAAQCALS